MGALRERLSIVSAERIRDELDRLIVLPDPEAGLWFIVRNGLADEFLPEIPALALEQDAIHRHKDVLAHTIAVVGKTRSDKILRLAALLHDIGKPRTRTIGPEGVSFHHHDVLGARLARRRLEALRYPTNEIDDISRLVELHLRFHTYKMGWTDSALRRYARDAGPLLGRLNELTRADCTTRNVDRAQELAERVDELERRLGELAEREALDAIRPELDGDAVMARLGIPPGRRSAGRCSSSSRSGSRRVFSARRKPVGGSTPGGTPRVRARAEAGFGSVARREPLDELIRLVVVVLHGRGLHEVRRTGR